MNTEERFGNIDKELADQKRTVRLVTGLALLALGLAVGSVAGQYFFG
jgi:hypothetical protein